MTKTSSVGTEKGATTKDGEQNTKIDVKPELPKSTPGEPRSQTYLRTRTLLRRPNPKLLQRRRMQTQTYLQTYHPGRGAQMIESEMMCQSSIGDAALTLSNPDLSSDLSSDLSVLLITCDHNILTFPQRRSSHA
jgi:hypothetical protein